MNVLKPLLSVYIIITTILRKFFMPFASFLNISNNYFKDYKGKSNEKSH